MTTTRIIRTASDDPDFRILVTQLDAELREMYAELMDVYDQHNIIEQIDTVVVAYLDDQAVGCGCFRKIDAETAEIKRMFVSPAARGKSISKLILHELEIWGCQSGFKNFVLETDTKNLDAHYLYQKAGYRIIPNYGPYAELSSSISMGKQLS